MLRRARVAAEQVARRGMWEGERLRWRLFHPVMVGVRVILAREGRVLLVRHSYRPGWFLPGGGVDKGETLEEAARREAHEEAGATLAELRLLGVYADFAEEKDDYIAVFGSERFEWAEPAPGGEITAVRWFAPEALPADTDPGSARRIAEWVAGAGPMAGRW
jgi:8-oxo-dGTP pyrophosphatase MutT (NUDIX family)